MRFCRFSGGLTVLILLRFWFLLRFLRIPVSRHIHLAGYPFLGVSVFRHIRT
jgi:hypothetical protein